jgi:ATP-dependent DNA helicase RecQ
VIDVLRGSDTEKVRKFGHDALSTWAIGADLDAKQWSSVFRQLVATGLLEADVERHGALRFTADSAAVLRGERTLLFRTEQPKAARKSRDRGAGAAVMPDLAPMPLARFNALRDWRATTAREQNVPAYVIFHDSTLRAIAEAAPDDLDELSRIPGIGSTKLERYGDAVLEQLFAA